MSEENQWALSEYVELLDLQRPFSVDQPNSHVLSLVFGAALDDTSQVYSLWMVQTNGKCANNTPSSQIVKTKKRALTGASLFLCFGNSPTRRLWQEPVLAEVV